MVGTSKKSSNDEVNPSVVPETEQNNAGDESNAEILQLMNNEGPEYVMEHTIEVMSKSKEKLKQNQRILSHDFDSEAAIEDEEDEDNDDISHAWYTQTQDKYMHKPWYAKPSIAAILFVLVLRVLCTTLLMTPTVGILSNKLCDLYAYDSPHEVNFGHVFDKHRCDMKAVQKEQSNITSWVTLINSIVGIVLGGKYGEFSDRLGRVFVLKLVGFIGMVYTVLMILAFHPSRPYQKWLVMLAMTSDITGGILTLISIGNSYMSDIISPREGTLAVYISLLMSIVYGSLGIGPLISSYVIKMFNGNLIVPYYFTFGLSIVYLFFVFAFIKESRHQDAQKYSAKVLKKNRLRRKSSISSLRSSQSGGKSSSNPEEPVKLKVSDRLYVWLHMTVIEAFEPIGKLWIGRTAAGSLVPRINTVLLIAIDTFFCSATTGFIPVLMLYSLVAYDWTSVELGYYISICGLGRALVLLFMPVLISSLKKRLNFKVIPNGVDSMDKLLLNASMAFLILSTFVLFTFKQYSWSLYVSAVFQTMSAVISPTIQSCVLKYNSKKISGQVFAAHTQIRHLTMVFAPIIFLQTYSHTYDSNPMLILSIPLILSTVAFVLLQFVRKVDDPTVLRRESEVDGIKQQSLLERGPLGTDSSSYGSVSAPRREGSASSLTSLVGSAKEVSNPRAGSSNRSKPPALDERRPSILNRGD